MPKLTVTLKLSMIRLQQERIAAFKEFIADVNDGSYPEKKHTVGIKDKEFEAFLAQVG